MNSHDQDIIHWANFRKGNKEAFSLLFRKFYGDLFLFGSKFTADKQLLEDVIHELFIELWQSKSTSTVISVKAYLLKALRYKLLKAVKKAAVNSSLPEQEDSLFEWSHENFLIESQETEERKQLVLNAISKLTQRQKEIIYLKYYQNLSYEEVSEIMNINYQVSRNLLYQSIKTLKKLLLISLTAFFIPVSEKQQMIRYIYINTVTYEHGGFI